MNSDSDLADRLHAHEVVCKTALKLAANIPGWRSHNKVIGGSKRFPLGSSLNQIGAREFGLTDKEVEYCLARARNFLLDVREADRKRRRNIVVTNMRRKEKAKRSPSPPSA